MTRTTDLSTLGGVADAVTVHESYRRYRFDAASATTRTDTPDLMQIFSETTAGADAPERRDYLVERLITRSLSDDGLDWPALRDIDRGAWGHS